MRILIGGLLLALLSGTVIAQPPQLSNADVVERLSMDPAEAVRKTGDGWFAMELPAIEGTRASCCRSGNWKYRKETGCSLDEDAHSYGTTSHSRLFSSPLAWP